MGGVLSKHTAASYSDLRTTKFPPIQCPSNRREAASHHYQRAPLNATPARPAERLYATPSMSPMHAQIIPRTSASTSRQSDLTTRSLTARYPPLRAPRPYHYAAA